MLRRTFLFVIGIFIARQLTLFFTVAENRSNFIDFLIKLTQQMGTWLSGFKEESEPQTLPSSSPKTARNPETATPSPAGKASTSSKPLSKATPKSKVPPKKGKPIRVSRRVVGEVPFYQTIIDLTDPDTFITLGLANNAKVANNFKTSAGDEPFENMVDRYPAAVIANGTFFGKDERKAVLGNMVKEGEFVKYSRWENYGTTLGLRAGNRPEMITTRIEGKPEWNQHWFSLTCGPRLLKQGKVWLAPKAEGFADPHVLNIGARTAIGFPQSGKELYLITFLTSLSLAEEAQAMKDIGCYEAMNLDGGASVALAHNGEIIIPAGRNLTNTIVVYDVNYPAPPAVRASWVAFQNGKRSKYPQSLD